jgi:predicted  nucleic acid-binding Zn-ribbon protein
MSTGLKDELGLADPKPGEPSAQKDEFKQKFKTVIDPVNENLQYTSAHASQSKHDAHASKKEVSYQAYQAALSKIDPKDPAVAQGDIDKAMTAIEGLGKVIEEFRQASEKAFNAWNGRQSEVDSHSDKIREMQEWGHSKAVALNGVADAIKGKANERSYDEANGALDQMLGKMKPIVEDYERQKVAQQEFEPAFQALQPRLEGTRACGFAALLQQKQELSTGTEQMTAVTTTKDYVSALPQLKTLEASVASFEAKKIEIEAKKQQYEQALESLKPKLGECAQCNYKKLAPMQQEIETIKGQMESAGQAEDYEQALNLVTDLGTKVDTYQTALKDLEEKKKLYEQALEAVKPKLDEAGQKAVYAKLASQKQEYESLKGAMETAAQGEDYELALQKATDLTGRVDAYIQAVNDLEEKKRQYEQALEALKPKLDEAGQKPAYTKFAQQKQNYELLKGEMETAAQGEDYEQAAQKSTDLTGRVDAYIQAVNDLEVKKRQYEQALEALKPKLDEAGQKPAYAKLTQQKSEYEALKGEMETAATGEDFEAALQKATDLTGRVDAYTQAVNDLEAKKRAYEQALEALRPKLDEAGQKPAYAKLAQQKQDYESLKGDMETAAQGEDFEAALQKAIDLTGRVDAYIQAVNDLEAKKREYEQALEALKPKLDEAGQKPVYQKLSQQKSEYESLKGELETAATGEDYEAALQKATDLTGRVDAYSQAVNDLEAKKREYEQALEALKPKLDEAGQKSAYAKLSGQKSEYESLKGEMETAATAEDYEAALQKATDLTGRVDAYIKAVDELEAKKKEYEQALEAVKPKLDEAGQKTAYAKLATQKQEYEALKGEMETVAQGEDYEAALTKATDLTPKVDAYLTAVKDLEEKKKQYEQALEAVKPKLDEAGQKTVYAKLATQKQEYESLKGEMETAAQGEDYEAALTKCKDLTTRVEAYITAVDALEAKKKEYEDALPGVKSGEADGKKVYEKLQADKEKYTALKTEMETNATAEDYESALAKCKDLTTQVEAYITAVDALEAKKKEYEAALEPLKSKLDEAAKSQHPDAASLPTLRTQMETNAQNGDYDQALKLLDELKTKVESILAAPRVLEKLDRDSDGSPKGGGAPPAPAGNLVGFPGAPNSPPVTPPPGFEVHFNQGYKDGRNGEKGGGAPRTKESLDAYRRGNEIGYKEYLEDQSQQKKPVEPPKQAGGGTGDVEIDVDVEGGNTKDLNPQNSDFIDKRISAAGVGLNGADFIIFVDDKDEPISVPFSDIDLTGNNYVAVDFNVYASRDEALSHVSKAPPGPSGSKPFGYYRGVYGLIVPTTLSPATAPETVKLLNAARAKLTAFKKEVTDTLVIAVLTLGGAALGKIGISRWLVRRQGLAVQKLAAAKAEALPNAPKAPASPVSGGGPKPAATSGGSGGSPPSSGGGGSGPPSTGGSDKPSFPAPQPKPAEQPPAQPQPASPKGGGSTGAPSTSSEFRNWNLEDTMRGSPYKPTQRIVYRGTVEKMAKAMKNNEFNWNGMDDPIIVDEANNLVQGHHRVVAARLSNTKIPPSSIRRLNGEPIRDSRPWENVTVKAGEKP